MDKPYMYKKKVGGNEVIFLVLYVEEIYYL